MQCFSAMPAMPHINAEAINTKPVNAGLNSLFMAEHSDQPDLSGRSLWAIAWVERWIIL
jgi:hypothetical protein